MKVAVIGLGSMGRRRIRLIRQYIPETKLVGVDLNPERRKQVGTEFDIPVFASLEDACSLTSPDAADLSTPPLTSADADDSLTPPDAAFVCTAPLSHKNIISELLDRRIHVFTELNLVADGYDRFVSHKESVLFLSSTLLYRKDIQCIQEKVAGQRVNYIYHSGQYLPDWHPWENYKDFFVNEKRTNGCREIFAIDLPWIIRTFGDIKSLTVEKGTLSSLGLPYPDNYCVMLTHQNGTCGLLAVDVVSRKPTRRLEVFSENLHLFWEGRPDSLTEYDAAAGQSVPVVTYERVEHNPNYCDNIIETAYLEEILTFFDTIHQKPGREILYTFADDLRTLSVIDEIEGNDI